MPRLFGKNIGEIMFIESYMMVVGLMMSSIDWFQIRILVKNKDGANVSKAMWSILVFCKSQWMWYGWIVKDSISLAVSSFIGVLSPILILYLIHHYKKPKYRRYQSMKRYKEKNYGRNRTSF